MIFFCRIVCRFQNYAYLCNRNRETKIDAEIAQLVEHNLAKVGVASSSLVFRSIIDETNPEVSGISCPSGGMVDALVSGASG